MQKDIEPNIYLLNYEEIKFKINDKDSLMIIGKVERNFNLIRIIINNNIIYEVWRLMFFYRNISLFDLIKSVIDTNQYNITFNENKENLVFKTPYITILLHKKTEKEMFNIINEKSVKLLNAFNKKYLVNISDDKIININCFSIHKIWVTKRKVKL